MSGAHVTATDLHNWQHAGLTGALTNLSGVKHARLHDWPNKQDSRLQGAAADWALLRFRHDLAGTWQPHASMAGRQSLWGIPSKLRTDHRWRGQAGA